MRIGLKEQNSCGKMAYLSPMPRIHFVEGEKTSSSRLSSDLHTSAVKCPHLHTSTNVIKQTKPKDFEGLV